MESRVNYLIVGAFVVSLAALVVIGIIWFSASQSQPYTTYAVYMNEPVFGLSPQAPVKFNGVEVGRVSDISLDPTNPQQVRLLLQINEGTPINQSTVASLMTQGITGVTYIGLKANAPSAPPLQVNPGEKYPIIPSAPSLFMQLDRAVREVTLDFKKISILVQRVLSKENQEAFHRSLVNIARFTQTLADHSKQIGETIQNASATFRETQTAAQSLSHQALPSAVRTLDRLPDILDNLDQLTTEVKDNPSLIIRGKSAPPAGPGE